MPSSGYLPQPRKRVAKIAPSLEKLNLSLPARSCRTLVKRTLSALRSQTTAFRPRRSTHHCSQDRWHEGPTGRGRTPGPRSAVQRREADLVAEPAATRPTSARATTSRSRRIAVPATSALQNSWRASRLSDSSNAESLRHSSMHLTFPFTDLKGGMEARHRHYIRHIVVRT